MSGGSKSTRNLQKQERRANEFVSTVESAFNQIWLRQNFKKSKFQEAAIELGSQAFSQEDTASKLTDHISNAIQTSQLLLREYFRNMFEFTFSESSFKKDVKLMCSNWLSNRKNPLVKVIDTFAIIAEAFLFCDCNRDYNLELKQAPDWFQWFTGYLSSKLHKSGGWVELDRFCEREYSTLFDVLKPVIEKKGKECYWEMTYTNDLIETLRNSRVMFPVPDDKFPTTSKTKLDETRKRNLVYYRTLKEVLTEQGTISDANFELPQYIVLVEKQEDQYVCHCGKQEKPPKRRKLPEIPKQNVTVKDTTCDSESSKLITKVSPNIPKSTTRANLRFKFKSLETAELSKLGEFTFAKDDSESKTETDTSKDLPLVKDLPSEISQPQDSLTASDKFTDDSESTAVEDNTSKELSPETGVSSETSKLKVILKEIEKFTDDFKVETDVSKEFLHSKELLSKSIQVVDVSPESEEYTEVSKSKIEIDASKELPIEKETISSREEDDSLGSVTEAKIDSTSLSKELSLETELSADILKESEKSADETDTLKELPHSKDTEAKIEVSKKLPLAKETLPSQTDVYLTESDEDTETETTFKVDSVFPSRIEPATFYSGVEYSGDKVNQFYLISEEYFDDLNKAVTDAEKKEKDICLLKFEGHPVQYKNDVSRQLMVYNQNRCYFLGGSKKPSGSGKGEK